MNKTALAPNLLDCFPQQVVNAEINDTRVVLLRPRFISGPLARWLQPRLKKPYFRVHLDDIGSFVWKLCDGQTTVGQIIAAMHVRFGENQKALEERLHRFLGELERGQMIRFRPPNAAPQPTIVKQNQPSAI